MSVFALSRLDMQPYDSVLVCLALPLPLVLG